MAKEERGPHQRNRERTKRETNRVEMGKDKIGKMRHEIGHFNSDDVDPGEDDYGYYYPNYNYTYDDVAASKPTSSPADENPTGSEQRSESPSEGVDPGEKLSLPKDPEVKISFLNHNSSISFRRLYGRTDVVVDHRPVVRTGVQMQTW